MLEEVKKEIRTSIVPLLGGIIEDLQILVRQEISLLKFEAKQEVSKAKVSLVMFLIAMGFCLVGLFLLCLAAAHLLNTTFPQLHQWHCYAIVGAFIALVGVIALQSAGEPNKRKYRASVPRGRRVFRETVNESRRSIN